jgi:hypothetical protein
VDAWTARRRRSACDDSRTLGGGSGQRWPEVLGGVISYEGSVQVDALMRLVRRSRGLPDALGSCRSGSRGRFAKLGRARGSTYVMRVWLQLEDAQCFRQRAWLRRKVCCVLCAVCVCCVPCAWWRGRLLLHTNDAEGPPRQAQVQVQVECLRVDAAAIEVEW